MYTSSVTPISKNNKWKQFEYQNLVGYNNNTLHTFGFIFEEHLLVYFKKLIQSIYPLDIHEYEMPQRDPGYQRSHTTNKQMFNRSNLPRAVMMYNLDVNKESDYIIPNQHDITRFRHSQSIEMLKIETSIDDNYVDYLKDVTMVVVGMEQENVASIFFSILVDNYVDFYELSRKLKMCFPDERWLAIYRKEVLDKETGVVHEVPFTCEYMIPRSIIENMKKILHFDSDEVLAKFLKKYSYNKIVYKVNGSTQEYDFYISMYTTTKIKCVNIDAEPYSGEGANSVYGIKLEFELRYIDIPLMKLAAIGNILNVLNKDNKYEPGKDNIALPIYIRSLPKEINGTTEYNTYEITYVEEDMETYNVIHPREIPCNESYCVPNITVKRPTLPFVLSDNGLVNEYIEDVLDEYARYPEEVEKRFNIILTAKKVSEDERFKFNSNNLELNIEKNYIGRTIIDKESHVGDTVYISLYLNKKDFNEWKIEKGYEIDDNLSSKY